MAADRKRQRLAVSGVCQLLPLQTFQDPLLSSFADSLPVAGVVWAGYVKIT